MSPSDGSRDPLFVSLDSFLRGTEGLAVVKAPPGSGRTFLLLRLATEVVDRGTSVAVAAQTNAQADDICVRLAHDLPRSRR